MIVNKNLYEESCTGEKNGFVFWNVFPPLICSRRNHTIIFEFVSNRMRNENIKRAR